MSSEVKVSASTAFSISNRPELSFEGQPVQPRVASAVAFFSRLNNTFQMSIQLWQAAVSTQLFHCISAIATQSKSFTNTQRFFKLKTHYQKKLNRRHTTTAGYNQRCKSIQCKYSRVSCSHILASLALNFCLQILY